MIRRLFYRKVGGPTKIQMISVLGKHERITPVYDSWVQIWAKRWWVP